MAGKHSRRRGWCHPHRGRSKWRSRCRLTQPGDVDHRQVRTLATSGVRRAGRSGLAERPILRWLKEEEMMDVTRAIAAALVGAGVMVGGPAAAQGRPQDSYALADAPIPVAREAVAVARIEVPAGTAIPVELDEEIPIEKDRMGDVFPP